MELPNYPAERVEAHLRTCAACVRERSRLENLAELVAVAREYEESDPDGSVAGFLERVALGLRCGVCGEPDPL